MSTIRNNVYNLSFRAFIVVSLLFFMIQTGTVAQTVTLKDKPIGYCTVNGSCTGGGNAAPTTVKTFAELKAAVQDNAARVIMVCGTIKTTDGGGYALQIVSNKTLIGADKDAKIYGGIAMKSVSNVIVRNLNIQGVYPNSGPDDAVSVQNSDHIWLDHLNIWDAGDGNLDITNKSSYVTVSWCKFWYTDANHPHRLCSLIGSGGGDHPEDWGYLKVTYHHNWFADKVNERMPRLMYGQAHVFNDYYTCSGNLYCIGVGSYGAALIENNYFKNVKGPHVLMYNVYCWITAKNNAYDNTTGNKDAGYLGERKVSGQDFNVTELKAVPYTYTLDKAADVPALVGKYAGPQNITTTTIVDYILTNRVKTNVRTDAELINISGRKIMHSASSAQIRNVKLLVPGVYIGWVKSDGNKQVAPITVIK